MPRCSPPTGCWRATSVARSPKPISLPNKALYYRIIAVPVHDVQRGASLNERAIESLEFIRTTMARSAPFTAVPGRGGIAMGTVALVAASLGAREQDDWRWLPIWLAAAVIAVPLGVVAMRWKASRYGIALWSAAGRRFAQGFVPAVAAGGILSMALATSGRFDLVPATWLLLYGAGVLAGSTASVPVLAWLGAAFMGLGVGALLTGSAWRDLWLGAGFGGLQIAFGIIIARKHGG